MGMPEGCPCEAVKELKILVERHEQKLNEGNVNFALIKQDLDYIKGRLDEKKKFNYGVVSAIINGACMILMSYIALKLGLA